MLTAFCFIFEWKNNFGLSSVPSGYMGKSQYFKRAETLIKYFKQRKLSCPLFLSLSVNLASSVLRATQGTITELTSQHWKYKRRSWVCHLYSIYSPCFYFCLHHCYQHFCWPGGYFKQRTGLREGLMFFSTKERLKWGLMGFRVWKWIIV